MRHTFGMPATKLSCLFERRGVVTWLGSHSRYQSVFKPVASRDGNWNAVHQSCTVSYSHLHHHQRKYHTMSTATATPEETLNVLFPLPVQTGTSFSPNQSPGVTAEASIALVALLKDNHDRFHIFFNDRGFHK